MRRIELAPQKSEYVLEYSGDGKHWTLLTQVCRECSNGYYEYPEGVRARYVRLTGENLPYGQTLRIFGNGEEEKPARVKATASRHGELDCTVSWTSAPTVDGYVVRYGTAPDKLYMSWMVYGASSVNISTPTKDQSYWFCIDCFNENGITTGGIISF